MSHKPYYNKTMPFITMKITPWTQNCVFPSTAWVKKSTKYNVQKEKKKKLINDIIIFFFIQKHYLSNLCDLTITGI